MSTATKLLIDGIVEQSKNISSDNAREAFLYTLAQKWVAGHFDNDVATQITLRTVRAWDLTIPPIQEVASAQPKPSMEAAGYEFVRWSAGCGAIFRDTK